ncbi:DUF5675 family protein [Carboxylicivirga sp. N1Y90]|uniref:DUF5675 family protein n=1 Tax=Carboxylicivirga fragile TaxID=3417571 RepID=UPI003D326B7D|nr:hypothetical protein [Marinilabiliaceae bacterium N1Y90]
MQRFLLLIVIAGIVFLLVLFVNRPDLIENIWIWLVGLAGSIVKSFQLIIDFFKDRFGNATTDTDQNKNGNKSNTSNGRESSKTDATIEAFKGTTITVLRISDDEETTIGLLYIDSSFYCYTLEDTYNEVKIKGQTRIPAGTYNIDFLRQETPLTLKYRERYPDWFNFHLHIQNVPGFTGIYIHSGGNHQHTEGCLLVSNSLSVGTDNSYLTNSRTTFKNLYKYLEERLTNKHKLRIIIRDENWIKELNH